MRRTFFLILFLTALLGISGLWAADPVYVDDDFDSSTPGWGSTHFATIANGITNVDAGGTIYVSAGNYASCGISKSVTLSGPNSGIHPAVGTHATETVGTRVGEAVWSGCVPSADNITIDGFHFLKAGTRMIDTYADANNFVLKNCIVESTTSGSTTGVIQFGGGSHTNSIFEFNLFTDEGDHTFYAGGGPYDGLIFRYNKFQSAGNAIFWSANPLVDGLIQGNEFDGENGTNYNTINIGNAGNIQITDNWVHDCIYTAFQVGIIGGSITGNNIQRTYPYPGYGSRGFELWGGAWGTAISANVTVSDNTFYYNDLSGNTEAYYGLRLNAPENTGDPSIDGSTIHVFDNTFIDEGLGTGTAYAIRHQGDPTTTVDAEENYWGTVVDAEIAAMCYGLVDYDPWYMDAAMTRLSNQNVQNTDTGEWFTMIQEAIDDLDTVAGHTIQVGPGTYNEAVTINTMVKLQGSGDSTIISSGAGFGIMPNVGGTSETERLVIKDFKITGSTYGIHISQVEIAHITLENLNIDGCGSTALQIQGTGTLPNPLDPAIVTDLIIENCKFNNSISQMGISVDKYSSVDGLYMNNCQLNGNRRGFYSQRMNDTVHGYTYITDVHISNTQFNNNRERAAYLEKFDNAVLDNIHVEGNGYESDSWNTGFEINLKYADYENIEVKNSTFIDNGSGNTQGYGTGLNVKARDDATSYDTFPASLTGLSIHDNEFQGNQRGIGIGEYGKVSDSVTGILIEDNLIYDNSVYGLVNSLTSELDASPNYWGDSYPVDDVSGNVAFIPWWEDQAMTVLGYPPVHNETQDTWYFTIQAAIDDANSAGGDEIVVSAGQYTEALYINKDITLTGAGRDVTTVYAPATLPSYTYNSNVNVLVSIDNCTATITGFTFDGQVGGVFHGVHFWESSGQFSNCTITGVRQDPFSGAQGCNALVVNHVWDVTLNHNVTISNNIIDDFGKTGILISELGASATITGNTIVGQGDAIEGQAAQNGIQIGYGATATISGNTISEINFIPDSWAASGILIIGSDEVSITGNYITDNVESGIYIGDDETYGYGGSNDAAISDNTLSGCDYAVEIGSESSVETFSNNSFSTNLIHVSNSSGSLDVNNLIPPTNTYDNYIIIDQVIYGNGTVLYVDAPNELIKDEETQTYSVVASHVEDMRSFQTEVKILKEDFGAPSAFTIGPLFSAYPSGATLLVTDRSDATHWIYFIGGFYNDQTAGITGDNVVLFTFPMTSLPDASAPEGSLVDLTYDETALKKPSNTSIPCAGTLGKLIYIDSAEPEPVTWTKCLTSVDGNNSIDLEWTNPADAFKNQIWRFDYADLTGANAYPTYNGSEFTVPSVPEVSTANGWTLVTTIDAAEAYTDASMDRGYYYYAVLAEDEAGNISVNNETRESISYWPGDVDVAVYPDEGNGTVTSSDISLLSASWGLTTATGMVAIVDVGPSTDYARRSRPCPDGRIDIEDMMMFAMNYYNTNYNIYPRDGGDEPGTPVTIAMDTNTSSQILTVSLRLGENDNQVRGLELPLAWGAGLSLVSVEAGDAWPEDHILLYTQDDNLVTVSASALGAEAVIPGNGIVATLVFDIFGEDTSLELGEMIARDSDNRGIVITQSPGNSTENEDLVNVIPAETYLAGNFPNPFNPSTTVQFGLKEADNVRINIYNNRGQLVKTLVNAAKAAGTYQVVWNGRDNSGRAVSSGMYLIRLVTSDTVKSHKALMLK